MRRNNHPAVRTWHVFARGARRLALFYKDEDCQQLLLFLQEALILSGCALFGYVLMGNHYHLMLRGSQAQITRCMQRLNWRYALFHNDTHRMGGHVFDGPYQAFPQRTFKWALWRLAYIFLNPVTAGRVGRPEDYRWSGYRSFMGLEGSPLQVEFFPELAAQSRSLAEARDYFALLLKEQQSRGKRKDASTPTAAEIQLDQFDWICRQAEDRTVSVPSVDPVALSILWGRESGIPPRVMARALGMADRHGIRSRLLPLQQALKEDGALARRLTL